MGESDIPKNLRSFIARFVGSVEQIEVLLLLFRHSERSWTAEEISRHLRSSTTSIESRLRLLRKQGFLKQDLNDRGRVSFGPRDPDLARLVELLEAEYRTRMVRVIEAVYAGATDKMMALVDAFDLRTEE